MRIFVFMNTLQRVAVHASQASEVSRSHFGCCSLAWKPEKTCYNYRNLVSYTCLGSGREKDCHANLTGLP